MPAKPASAITTSVRAPNALSFTETLSLVGLVFACVMILSRAVLQGDGAPLIASLALGGIAFSATYAMIRWLGPAFLRAGIKGVDLSKTQRREIPECMGAICAVVYILSMICFIPFPFYKDIVAATSGGGNRDVVIEQQRQSDEFVQQGRFLHRFPHSKLASYLSAIISLQSIALLGIGDDLFDIRWRHKFFIPAFAAIPLLVVYFVDFGVTSIVVPIQLQPYLGELIDLGPLYYIFMAAVAIFSPNSINILAGVNGIEVSQALVIACLLAFNDTLYLLTPYPHPAVDSHLFSLYFLVPFIGVATALLLHNWYPARVFVGDTFCYLAGMVFVVVSILGHFTKTLALLLIPQVFNFVYSAPQIFGIIPCPRHRLPRFNHRTGLLEPSVTPWATLGKQPSAPVALILRLLARCKFVALTEVKAQKFHPNDHDKNDGNETITENNNTKAIKRNEETNNQISETSNLTLLNLWLVWRGPMREDRLALEITMLQIITGLLGLFVRHKLALLIFRQDNWSL